MNPTQKRLFLLFCALVAGAAQGAGPIVVPPLAVPGPYAVACSNVTQDFRRMAPGEDVQLYWEGVARANFTPRAPTDLLSDQANTPSVTVNAPGNFSLYGSFAGRAIPYVLAICYPTTADNPRPDYPLPTGRNVPHMQRGGEAPLWPDATTRYPVLLFSHGYGGSPLSNEYLAVMTTFASFGYVVAAPFHMDAKFADLKIENLYDAIYVLLHFPELMAMQALRPLALSKTIDLLLAHPHWRDRVDSAQIGGFGASMGGQSMLLLAGAGLTTSLGFSRTQIVNDRRLRAAVGYVPYFGHPILPSFGRDQGGLDDVTLSYLAISGMADATAPLPITVLGMTRLAGTRELVGLIDVVHGFDVRSTADIFTWAVTYLDAEVRGDRDARAKLEAMAIVAGGGDDLVMIPFNGPSPVNYGGLWWNAPAGSESGWGINVAHQADSIVATWFTYDAAGRGWWLVMTAPKVSDGVYSGTFYETRGPAFGAVPFSPSLVTPTPVGSATLTFNDASNGTLAYAVNGVSQTKNITRQVFGPLPTCTFGAQPDLRLATNYQDLWWGAPAASESGWGINLNHQGDTIFATWFTYDVDGMPLWLVVTARKTGTGLFSGDLYRTAGGRFDAFNPAQVTATKVGTATFAFADGNTATFGYSVQLAAMPNPVTQSKAITREVFALPGTACQ